MRYGLFLGGALAVAAMPAAAASVTRNVTITPTSPTFNAPQNGTPPTALTGSVVPYNIFAFTVDQSASYTLGLSASGGFRPFLSLYDGWFDPTAPLANVLAAQNYAPPFNSFATINRTLTAGSVYVAVLGGERAALSPDGNAYGIFSVSGPGTITPATPVAPGVPEPATWAMLLLGFGGIGQALRRRRAPAVRVRFV